MIEQERANSNDEDDVVAVEDGGNDEEDEYANEVQLEDTFMVDLSEILQRIHREVHGEEGCVELQDELHADQELEIVVRTSHYT